MLTTNVPRLLVLVLVSVSGWLGMQLLSACSSSSPRDQNWDSAIGRDDGAVATGGAGGDQTTDGTGGAGAAGGQAGSAATGGATGDTGGAAGAGGAAASSLGGTAGAP